MGKVLSSNFRAEISDKEKRRDNRRVVKEDDDGFGMEQETGAEAGNKAKKAPLKKKEDPGKDIKLPAGNSKKIADELKKLGIRISEFMQKILNQ